MKISKNYWKLSFQSGRSMTEMLGVLAIIGVLSVTALMGYNYAITKHKANATINDLNQFVVIVTQQLLNGHTLLDLSEAGNKTTLNYPATAYILDDPSYFEIALAQVPPAVCKQILRESLKEVLAIKVNSLTYVGDTSICETDDEGTPVEMDFQFTADLNAEELPYGTCKVDANCAGDCAMCNEDNLCVSRCTNGERCGIDKDTGDKVCCPSDRRSGPYCCPSTVNGWCCDENQQNCCPWHKPLRDKNGTCYACDYASGVDVTGVNDNCNVCGEREVIGNFCVEKCPMERPLRHYNGECKSCYEKNAVLMNTPWNYCKEKCPNRIAAGGLNRNCSLPCQEGQFMDTNGNCYDCDDERSYDVTNVTHDGCEVCPDRKKYAFPNGAATCILDCAQGEFRGDDGKCYDCEEPDAIYMLTAATYCSRACPNRIASGGSSRYCIIPCTVGTFTGNDGKCYACDDPRTINTAYVPDQTECESCSNRKKVPATGNIETVCLLECGPGHFRGDDGICYDCHELAAIPMLKAATYCTLACPNRMANGMANRYCSIKCPQGTFTGEDGTCYDCDVDKIISVYQVTHEGCDQCPDRKWYNTKCALACPNDKPLKDINNNCYSCDTDIRVSVNSMTDACYECPNERKLDGNYCVLKIKKGG